MEAYERVFKEKITPEEASAMLARLVRLYRVLLRPLLKVEGEEVAPRS